LQGKDELLAERLLELTERVGHAIGHDLAEIAALLAWCVRGAVLG
jgi:hypothetical protein